MGKKSKEHRKKVAARNKRLAQSRESFQKRFQEELLKQIELEKQKRGESTNIIPQQESDKL